MTTTFAEKMAHVATQAGHVQKDAVNTFHKYRYASADAVLSAVRKAMIEAGLYFHAVDSEATWHGDVCLVRKTVTVTDGQSHATATAHGAGTDKGDKAAMKAETAAYKYAVAHLFGISWNDDPEADPETDKPAAHKPASKGLDKFSKPAPKEGRSWTDTHGVAGQKDELFEGLIAMLDAWDRIPMDVKVVSKGDHEGKPLIDCPSDFVMKCLDKAKGKPRSILELAALIQLEKEKQS